MKRRKEEKKLNRIPSGIMRYLFILLHWVSSYLKYMKYILIYIYGFLRIIRIKSEVFFGEPKT